MPEPDKLRDIGYPFDKNKVAGEGWRRRVAEEENMVDVKATRESWRRRYAEKLVGLLIDGKADSVGSTQTPDDFPTVQDAVEERGGILDVDLLALERLVMMKKNIDPTQLEKLEQRAKNELEHDEEWYMVLDGQRW